MSSLLNILGIGASGLRAHAYGTQLASNNAANVNTPGYTRRAAVLEAGALPPSGAGGVQVAGERRIVDPFVERRLNDALSNKGEGAARADALDALDRTFGSGPGNIAESLGQLRTAMGDMSANPGDLAARQVVLAKTTQLAQSFQRSATMLSDARSDANQRISDGVRQVNSKLQEIADLGVQIAKSEASGTAASDLRDRRDQRVREVAEYVPVKVLTEANGNINLLLGGSQPLVTANGAVIPLGTATDPLTGDIRVTIAAAGVTQDVTTQISSGRIGGLIQARDVDLSNAQDTLDQLAFDAAAAFNAAHSAGFGLDSVSGRNLFAAPAAVSGAASQMALSSDVSGNPSALAAAADAVSLPGDNRNALALLGVFDADVAASGTATLAQSYADLVAMAGSAAQQANASRDQYDAAATQVQALREAVSGVSTDEEMLDLTRYQRAYQASLKIIQTADEMLNDILSLKR